MDWLVFGDDWGAHPSTTQHLVRHLPEGDRVVWVDSLGMRAPRFDVADLRRSAAKLRSMVRRKPKSGRRPPDHVRVVAPRVLPWHGHPAAVAINRASLRASLGGALRSHGVSRAVALLSNPVGSLYLGDLPIEKTVYLRLDDYARLPGVDADLVAPIEGRLLAEADAVVVTARALEPDVGAGGRYHYLPQGVDTAHFGRVPARVPPGRVLGFFGLLAEWVDFELVAAVASRCPEWTLEFVGDVRHFPASVAALPNVHLRPAVAYERLPDAVTHWRAAWVPFVVNALTRAVNPLKLREYLAAGIPTACTPLPEARDVPASVVRGAAEVAAWLADVEVNDDPAARRARREAVALHGWGARAETLRRVVEAA